MRTETLGAVTRWSTRLVGRASTGLYGALRRSGVPAAKRYLSNQAVVLCFHNVVPDPLGGQIGDGPLHLPAARFRALIEWMSGAFHVVSLGELVDRLEQDKPLRGLAALTFDDGYRGFCRHAVPVLREFQTPASVFIVGDGAEVPAPFWWDRLGRGSQLDPADRLRCRDDLAGDARRIAAAYPLATGEELPDDCLPASWAELAGLPEAVSVESHTQSHPNLTRIDATQLQAELTGSRERIAARTGRAPAFISYPFGLSSPGVAAAARAAGYRAGFSLSFRSAGSIAPGSDRHDLLRINVPASLTVDALACWTAGFRRSPRS